MTALSGVRSSWLILAKKIDFLWLASEAFSIALRLLHGRNRPQEYLDPALWTDADLLSVVDKVIPYPTTFAPGMPALLSCRIDITLKDGRVLSRTQAGARGYPNHPDTRDSDIVFGRLNSARRPMRAKSTIAPERLPARASVSSFAR